MTPPLKDLDFCQKTTWKFKCGMRPSVFSTLEQKKMHNLHHFIPCTMCRMMLRSRDQLLNHLRVVHNQTELTRVKHHDAKCKTYNLPVIPLPQQAGQPHTPNLPQVRKSSIYGEYMKRVVLQKHYSSSGLQHPNIQKAGFPGSQKPQINLNFPQKDRLRTQKLSIP